MTHSSDFEDLTEYKATYSHRPQGDLKAHQCLLPISLGQPQHEGTKLKAALKLVNATFGKCIVVVADSLTRHSLAINNLDITKESLYKLSLERGQAWIDRNQAQIDQYLTIPHKILRWDHWLDTEEYRQHRDSVDLLYDTDADYNKAINANAERFIDNFMQKQELANRKRALQCSVEYLMEESAIIAGIWDKEGYKAVLYPGLNVAVAETMRLFNSKILWLKYRLNSRKSTALSFQNIIDASPANIYWKDSKGMYLGCNKAALQYAHLANSEKVIGKTDFDLLNYDFAKNIQDLDVSIMTKGEPVVVKETDNQGNVFLSHKSPLRNHDNEIIGIIGNSINITAQEEAEKKLGQRTQDLAVALEVKERFLRNMSHEIRTPLQAILAIPEGLKEQYYKLTDKEREEYIDIIVGANNRLMSLLSNLLDLSQFRQGKFVMDFKPENIKDVAEEVIGEFKYTHGNITLDVGQNVPETLMCDRFRIAYVVRNLIGNSIKHGGQSHPISVCISSYKDRYKQYVKCTVKDEGVGIPVDERDSVFDAFVESSKTKTNAGGTGLGLSVAQEIVQAHKGKIWVEDMKDGEIGTSVSFLLAA